MGSPVLFDFAFRKWNFSFLYCSEGCFEKGTNLNRISRSALLQERNSGSRVRPEYGLMEILRIFYEMLESIRPEKRVEMNVLNTQKSKIGKVLKFQSYPVRNRGWFPFLIPFPFKIASFSYHNARISPCELGLKNTLKFFPAYLKRRLKWIEIRGLPSCKLRNFNVSDRADLTPKTLGYPKRTVIAWLVFEMCSRSLANCRQKARPPTPAKILKI